MKFKNLGKQEMVSKFHDNKNLKIFNLSFLCSSVSEALFALFLYVCCFLLLFLAEVICTVLQTTKTDFEHAYLDHVIPPTHFGI